MFTKYLNFSFVIILLIHIVICSSARYENRYNILDESDPTNDFENTTIETLDPYQFRYVPAEKEKCFNFWVKAANEAHISLSNDAEYINPKIKIVIGGWNNAASAIVLNDNNSSPPVKTNTVGILNKDEYVGFWVQWSTVGDILIGRANEQFPFLVYRHSEQWYPINFIGVTCGPKFNGSWIIKDIPTCPYTF